MGMSASPPPPTACRRRRSRGPRPKPAELPRGNKPAHMGESHVHGGPNGPCIAAGNGPVGFNREMSGGWRTGLGIKSRLAASLTVVAMLGLLGVQSVTATHVAPGETMPGNYQCPAGSTKIDPVEDGTYALAGGGTITIDVRSTASGTVFDFTTNGATVGSIVVKGGPNTTPTSMPRELGRHGLHSPTTRTRQVVRLSHLCIESTKKGVRTPEVMERRPTRHERRPQGRLSSCPILQHLQGAGQGEPPSPVASSTVFARSAAHGPRTASSWSPAGHRRNLGRSSAARSRASGAWSASRPGCSSRSCCRSSRRLVRAHLPALEHPRVVRFVVLGGALSAFGSRRVMMAGQLHWE